VTADRPETPPRPDWNARYAAPGFLFGTEPNRFLASCRELLGESGRVLCVADGEGRNSAWLAAQGLEVDAFDGSPVGVAKAQRLAAERGVSVRHQVADVDGWDWPRGAYDAVVAIFIQFSPPAQRRRVFARIERALRPGGLFLLEGYSVGQLAHGTGGPRIPDQLYTEAQLRDELSEFALQEVRAYDAVIDEGPAHSGMSAVIDVIARRRSDTGGG
jgi:SAM-dependent methyltransferase